MSNITVSFTPTNRDFVWISYATLRSRPVLFAMLLGFFVVLPWLAAIAAVLTGAKLGLAFIVSLLTPPIMLGFFALMPLLIYRKSQALKGEHIYEFSDIEIYLHGPGFDNRVQWALITNCTEISGGLIFNSNKLAIISIPPRVLSSHKISSFRQLIENKGIEYKGLSRGAA